MNVQVVSFNCLLKNKLGQLISSTFNREVLVSVSAPNQPLVGLSKGLQNLKKGEKRTIAVSAEEAYGFYDPKKVILFPRTKLPKTLRVGETVSITGKSGTIRTYIVLQFHDGMVSLDGNHPLAGQDLIFEIEATEAREATPEEIDESVNVVSGQLLH
ncbi:peptidylprolyl isomerase [Bdellovibrio sp. ZAP7]|uniref:FKBP-type peptidyl-prolyl cis-trans isomerase n=1 Tax=Bdellovibrio sp. ZAP7 TaxID=2231053 RepID=UPI00115BE367|nr:FKBP-type peptidyl-prolyl cis-trans isomerase [Bdellovibrio sp. ZAP7]QDK46218.1 peptidylprolyl isomerase [Bdellovibrio sp. ZAP7]